MDDDALTAGDTVEAALVRASDLLDSVLQSLQDSDARLLVESARREVGDAALLVPAIGRIAVRRD